MALNDFIRVNGFGPFYADGWEFLRRVCVTVRDGTWQEVAPVQWSCSPDEAQRMIFVAARHTNERVDFRWEGRLQLATDGRGLSFQFDGVALKSMEVCRLGLVVLHPVETLTGATLTTQGPAGRETVLVSQRIAPQPFIDGRPGAMTGPFTSMSIEQPRIGRIELELAGDLFELEDQRNWGDASFKTYCTPLRLGFPRRVAAGTRISHSVAVKFYPAAIAVRSEIAEPDVAVNGGCKSGPPGPKIGRALATPCAAAANASWMMGWSHIGVDLDKLQEAELVKLLHDLPRATMLEVKIAIDNEAPAVCEERKRLLHLCSEKISNIVLRAVHSPLPTSNAVERFRAALRGGPAERLPLLVGPNGYFVEFNRNRSFDLDVDGIALPLSPTVHGDDPDTLLENMSTITDMVATAREITRNAPVCISPLAMHIPSSPKPNRVPRDLQSAWLASVIAQAARSGVASITLGADLIGLSEVSGTSSDAACALGCRGGQTCVLG